MIKYNNKTINKLEYNASEVKKMYYDSDVCYGGDGGGTPSSGLPSGYTEVEYIQNISGSTTPTASTNSRLAYIDTGFVPNEKTRVVIDMQVIQPSQNPRYMGSGKWNQLGYLLSQEWTIGESRARIYCKFGQSSGWIRTSYVPTLDRHTYDFNNDGKVLIDDVKIITLPRTSFTCVTNMCLFTASRPNDTYVEMDETVFAKMYSSLIYDDGTLVRNYVPCTRDSDGVAGFYDLVNNTFNTSANGNPLIAGNPV